MALDTARDRLAKRATTYKKAWILSCAWNGYFPGYEEVEVPNYRSWPKTALAQVIKDLEVDFHAQAKRILDRPDRGSLAPLAVWMSQEGERWAAAGFGVRPLGTAQGFESQFGRLQAHSRIEVPPYTELLLQGFYGLAYRHPEYMLARDLAFLYVLYQQAERALQEVVTWRKPPKWASRGSEHGQALARAVIQTCFNLLESFVSGLARAHVMTHKSMEDEDRKRLLDNTKPLKSRLLNVPLWISGRHSGLSADKPPLSVVFGSVKQRRDAFVHCEPGPEQSSRGYVKEEAFHDVSPKILEDALTGTLEIIRQTWSHLNATDKPRWLFDVSSLEAEAGLHLVPAVDADNTVSNSQQGTTKVDR
jgi:hypothetical protein